MAPTDGTGPPPPAPVVKKRKLAHGHYHITTPKGVFWVAWCEGAPKKRGGAWPTIWQIGCVSPDGYEGPAFDAADTMRECIELALGSEP